MSPWGHVTRLADTPERSEAFRYERHGGRKFEDSRSQTLHVMVLTVLLYIMKKGYDGL